MCLQGPQKLKNRITLFWVLVQKKWNQDLKDVSGFQYSLEH
jgi:hypothetical protein